MFFKTKILLNKTSSPLNAVKLQPRKKYSGFFSFSNEMFGGKKKPAPSAPSNRGRAGGKSLAQVNSVTR